MTGAPAPIILTARFAPEDFAWADALRREHFPPERNQLSAHLTLFHALPPSIGPELDRALAVLCGGMAPAARVARPISLGRGVALLIESPGLVALRRELAERFATCLSPQDANGFRPHITIQNKVAPSEARALLERLSAGFAPRPVGIVGVDSHWYRGGPWEHRRGHSFRLRPQR